LFLKVSFIIEKALSLVHNELKYTCTVSKDLGELPNTLANPQQIEQVIINILINASQAIKEKGLINIKTYTEGKDIFIKISDNGKGIPEETVDKIFDPFFTTKEVGAGTGLGLSIVYGIIEKHSGKIDAQSKVGEGTTFTIKLPIKT